MGQDELRRITNSIVEVENEDVTRITSSTISAETSAMVADYNKTSTDPERLNNRAFTTNVSFQEEKPICRICHCSNEDFIANESWSEQIQKQQQISTPNICCWKKLSLWSCDRTANSFVSKFIKNKQQKPSLSAVNDPFFLITPCYCTGSLQYVHHKCLQQWIRSSNHKYCELCKYNFKLRTKNKPFYQWECLNMSDGERRKLLFHIIFNLVSMICVFWSIYVIAERAAMELSGKLGWRFWIKMLVVLIGFVCGVMFIFFQLKLYFSILTRWKQYNQIVIIENVCRTNNSTSTMTTTTATMTTATSSTSTMTTNGTTCLKSVLVVPTLANPS